MPRIVLLCLLALLCVLPTLVMAQDVPVPDTAAADPAAADTVAADTVATEAAAPKPADAELQTRMQAVFSQIDEFADVTVQVREGVVRLTGNVIDAQASDNAVALAQEFDGVIYVDNDIEQTTDVETRVTPALLRIQEYWDGFIRNLPVIGVALVVVLLFWMLARGVGRLRSPFERFGVTPLVQNLVRRVLSTLIFVIGLLLALDILGITALVGAVLGTAGVFGIAIGFAFQDIVENYLAGILLSVQRPFSIGDLVMLEGQTGAIVRMTARELVLMTPEGNHVRLSNATVFKSTLTNFSRNPQRRFEFAVGVGTEEDLVNVMEAGLQVLHDMPGVEDDPGPFARVKELGDSTVTVEFFGWIDQRSADFIKVQSEAIRLIKQALDDKGVQMPEPIYRVLLRELPEAAVAQPKPPRHTEVLDVSPDRVLEEQVQNDLEASDEQNLLAEDGADKVDKKSARR